MNFQLLMIMSYASQNTFSHSTASNIPPVVLLEVRQCNN